MNRAKYADNAAAGKRSTWWRQYCESMHYALHVITHPFDGFWDLVHEKRGSMAAAHTFLFLFLLTRVLKLILTSFQFISAPVQHLNIFEEAASLLLPFLVLCLANWAMTTLFEGKGRFKDIYMGMCYALVPYTLIQLPMILVSNMLTYEEGSLYSVMLSISVIWCVFLVFVGLMEIHDYGPGKTFIFLIVTVVGALVIIFLVLTFFSLLSDALGYFVSLYREIVYRLY
uniref:NHL repeat containing protein n=1 Tax=uncultured bacterium Contigcl_1764b TaxID=1393658 RepID=W0FM90_9BACT|nr:NHL repeat containing protein [uncultured bacterium Contigcl_1764b]